MAAGLIGYPLPDTPEPPPDNPPAMFVPLNELEDLVPGTWYVNVLAAYPEHRGKGHGTALLGLAEQLARETHRRGMSIIVADTNTGARRLYERCGYREVAQAPHGEGGLGAPWYELRAAGEADWGVGWVSAAARNPT